MSIKQLGELRVVASLFWFVFGGYGISVYLDTAETNDIEKSFWNCEYLAVHGVGDEADCSRVYSASLHYHYSDYATGDRQLQALHATVILLIAAWVLPCVVLWLRRYFGAGGRQGSA